MKPPPSKPTATMANTTIVMAQSERLGGRGTGSASVRSRTGRMFWVGRAQMRRTAYRYVLFLILQRRWSTTSMLDSMKESARSQDS